MKKEYSHVEGYTKYMKIVFGIVKQNKNLQKILDIPAGNGLLADKLRAEGHDVICGDINEEKEHYVYADMSEKLPFSDELFDASICLEGVEHVLEPAQLISELCRVTKSGGQIIISLPNIQNMYSRFRFMCTGTFFQFNPSVPNLNLKGQKVDLGHISSLSYVQLRYLFRYFGAEIIDISGDKYKKKILLPFLLPFILIGYFWTKSFNKESGDWTAKPDPKISNLFNPNLLFSRSLILVFEKE